MAGVAIAAGSRLGARAAAEIARAGGNAVDACLAAAVAAWVAEPFFASIGGSGFALVRPAGTGGAAHAAGEVIDGNATMPLAVPRAGLEVQRVYLEYSNGMFTGVGGGSVAAPGILAAVHETWRLYGSIDWAALFEPAIDAALRGVRLSRTAAHFLALTWEPIWARYPVARALFGRDEPLEEGDVLVQGPLAESLRAIAGEGPGIFYGGALGTEIAAAVSGDDGLLTADDLSSYEVRRRAPTTTEAFGWLIESNPPPAVGGALLTHLLELLRADRSSDARARLRTFVEAEKVVVGYRRDRYEDPGDVSVAFQEAIAALRSSPRSSSTTHASAAGSDGLVCALTQSCGYGAGLVVDGVLLNNTLGEEELNPLGVHRLRPGSRCHSNMTPTIVTGPSCTVGLGSPGADRIVGAVAQTFLALARDGLSLHEAVAAPRAHLAMRPEGPLLCYEPGLPGECLDYPARPYDEPHMFFGAVQAASVAASGEVDAAHDPRRSGASLVV
jgi:gamma-glutamyltranspeptidase/glutathione hydrolase